MAYTKEQRTQILHRMFERIAQGDSVRQILREKEYPATDVFYRWIREDEEEAKLYTQACEDRAHVLADKALELTKRKEDQDFYTNDKGSEVPHSIDIQRDKLQFDALKWAASKLNPRKYGDKTDITSNGETVNTVPINVNIGGKKIDMSLD